MVCIGNSRRVNELALVQKSAQISLALSQVENFVSMQVLRQLNFEAIWEQLKTSQFLSLDWKTRIPVELTEVRKYIQEITKEIEFAG